jgi:uncharacterized protein YqgV (UPF0045/DUF77 family)
MSVIARLEVIPQREGSTSEAVARAVEALDEFDVSYETTPTDTIVEADDPSEVFAAAEAAHRAVSVDRLITSLEVDDDRTRTQRGRERVESVERHLGRPPRRRRDERASAGQRAGGERGAAGEGQSTGGRPTGQTRPSGRTLPTGQTQPTGQTPGTGQQPTGQVTGQTQPAEEPQRYGGPWRSKEGSHGERVQTGARTTSRYLRPRRPVSR